MALAKPALEHARSTVGIRWITTVGKFARRKPLGAMGAVIVGAMLVMAVFAERIAPYGYDDSIRGARMKAPSAAHWLGTDNLSRDMWSRIVYGARVSISVGFLTVTLAVLAAAAIGVSSAYFGGAWDLIVQRVVDAWLSFPYLIIILSVMAVLGPGLLNALIAIAIVNISFYARGVRAAVLVVRRLAFIEAARALGASDAHILLREVLPSIAAPLLVFVTLNIGALVVETAGLSFIGLGAQPPTADWGTMLSDAENYLGQAPWLGVFPGVAIFLTTLCFNLFGDGLRDALDPTAR